MPIDPRLLTVAQWLSPSYPLGSFAFSQGLERACADGHVHDARSLEAWLRDVVEVGSGRSDAVWIARAWHEDLPLAELDALARSYMPSSDRLREAERQGAAFARITSDVWQIEVPAVVLPVAPVVMRTLVARMPGDEWQQAANMRLYAAFMYAHPGKKLNFMGNEIAQSAEWNHDSSINWHLLEFDKHKGIQSLYRDLNHLYQQQPALHEQDCHHEGFEWIDHHNSEQSILSFVRK